MRLPVALAALLALLALVPTTHAAGMGELDFTEKHALRAAYGDNPITAPVEASGRWNLNYYERVHKDNDATWEPGTFTLAQGATLDGAQCSCGNVTVTTRSDNRVQVDYAPTTPAGDYVIVVQAHIAPSGTFTLHYNPGAAWQADFYVPAGTQLASNLAPTVQGLGCTSAPCQIWQYKGSANQDAWFGANPASLTTVADNGGIPWLWVGIGLVAGAIVWAVLVSRGLVQARSRRQVAATAAHVEAAKAEPAPVLEGKKRALMAALKEIEVAKMNQELAPDVYDAVKAEFKRQTVTVMRALEAPPK